MYLTATTEPISFPCVKLTARDGDEMFFKTYDKIRLISDEFKIITKLIIQIFRIVCNSTVVVAPLSVAVVA